MKIKTRLSLYFTLISSGALLLVLIALYLAVYSFSREDFYDRLTDRANVASQLYLKADEINADSLVQVQQRYLDKLNGEVIKVYDDDNKSAFNTHNNIFWTDTIIEQVRKDKYLKYQDGSRQVVGKLYHDNQGDFVILVSAVDRSFPRRVTMLSQVALVLFIVFTAVLFFAGQIFANRALAPIKKVITQMGQIRSSNLHMRVEGAKNKDEIDELISNFNSLLERLENAFELQQTFVANASHELRTPLTSIMGEVEVALTKIRNTDEYERILASISADALRLQETITSLMELAQVDMNYTQAKISPVRVDELLWELHESWTEKKGPGKLNLTLANMPDDESELEIQGNKPLLYIALNNIIDNAFKYSGGEPVNVKFEALATKVSITVTDKGPGISETDRQKILRPFYRAGNVKKLPGNGLGLYITDKIIQLCHGRIEVISDGKAGSTFVVQFIKNGVL
ncbi:HAMP domain-containing histidine kinase [Mucilaginibacter sp. UR6-1]|uniref:HAMP domain-containing sensor histidine kinase n=1 Tax=Mucilaginibacter sp. UR6-1 TaxID=1435643 RepID=UPI001E2C5F6D|nr:HAMP domain-containing sensor histidine kinase [Mucilaginibacter sp. UR6-1]MCC8410132.1 HAMP domain-containing histidine kinase [Mucilaginibacter sp. UR6-1]